MFHLQRMGRVSPWVGDGAGQNGRAVPFLTAFSFRHLKKLTEGKLSRMDSDLAGKHSPCVLDAVQDHGIFRGINGPVVDVFGNIIGSVTEFFQVSIGFFQRCVQLLCIPFDLY